MIIHEPALISEDILEKHFVCDLERCKGACCVEGDSGAPLLESERDILIRQLDRIIPFLPVEAVNLTKEKGIWEKDKDGELVTNCLPDGTCCFAMRNYEGLLKCGIEEAFNAGATTAQKPLSCHLYPIRVKRVGEYEALNYHRWDICKPACSLGEKHRVPLYKFLKTALIRKFGREWYNELEEIGEAFQTR